MIVRTITKRGQITLGKFLMQRMGLKSGDRLDAKVGFNGEPVFRPAKREGIRTIESLIGVLKRPGQPVLTIEEMNEAIARSRVEDDERIRRQWRDDQ